MDLHTHIRRDKMNIKEENIRQNTAVIKRSKRPIAWAVAVEGDANWWLCCPYGEPKPIVTNSTNSNNNSVSLNTDDKTPTPPLPFEAAISVSWLYPVTSKSTINKCKENNPTVFFPDKGDLLFQKKGPTDEIVVDVNMYKEYCENRDIISESQRDNETTSCLQSKIPCQFSRNVICDNVVVDYCFTRAPRSYGDEETMNTLKKQCEYFTLSNQEEALVTELYRSQYLDVAELLLVKKNENDNDKHHSNDESIESDSSYEHQSSKKRKKRRKSRKGNVTFENLSQKIKEGKEVIDTDFQLLECGDVYAHDGKQSDIFETNTDTDSDDESIVVTRRKRKRKRTNVTAKNKQNSRTSLRRLCPKSRKDISVTQNRMNYYIELEKRFFYDDTMNESVDGSNDGNNDNSNCTNSPSEGYVEVLPPALELINNNNECSPLLAISEEFLFVTSVDTTTVTTGDTYTVSSSDRNGDTDQSLLCWSRKDNAIIGSCRTVSTVCLSVGTNDSDEGAECDVYDIIAVTIPPYCSDDGKRDNNNNSNSGSIGYPLSRLLSKPVERRGSETNHTIPISRNEACLNTTQRMVVSSPVFELKLAPSNSMSSVYPDSLRLRCSTLVDNNYNSDQKCNDVLLSAMNIYRTHPKDHKGAESDIHTVSEGRYDLYSGTVQEAIKDPNRITSTVSRKNDHSFKNSFKKEIEDEVDYKHRLDKHFISKETRDQDIEVKMEDIDEECLDPLQQAVLDAQRDLLLAVTMAKQYQC